MATFYIAIDEAGTANFSDKKDPFYFFTAVSTLDPFPLVARLRDLRFNYLKQGINLQEFHAQNDSWPIRNSVFKVLQEYEFSIYSLYINKTKLPIYDRKLKKFYFKYLGSVLKFMLKERRIPTRTEQIIILLDDIPKKIRNKHTLEEIQKLYSVISHIPKSLGTEKPAYIYSHNSCSNEWIQVADYASWAIQRVKNNGDDEPYKKIQNKMITTPFLVTHYPT